MKFLRINILTISVLVSSSNAMANNESENQTFTLPGSGKHICAAEASGATITNLARGEDQAQAEELVMKECQAQNLGTCTLQGCDEDTLNTYPNDNYFKIWVETATLAEYSGLSKYLCTTRNRHRKHYATAPTKLAASTIVLNQCKTHSLTHNQVSPSECMAKSPEIVACTEMTNQRLDPIDLFALTLDGHL